MPTLRCVPRTLIAACIVVPMARPLAAQDSLRVLRFSPTALASVAEPVVITFDHPVAPRLDDSVDPERAVRVLPDVGRHSYWRDPSTLVVEFDSLWQAGARYRVVLDAGLRSAGGLVLTRGMLAREVTVGGARVLAVQQSRGGGPADTIVHALAVYSMPVTLAEVTDRATLLPDSVECGSLEPITLRPVLVRPIASSDGYGITEAGGYERDRRTDSLRRVVELTASRSVGRGCVGRLRVEAPDNRLGLLLVHVHVKPVFRAARAYCNSNIVTECPAGPVGILFTTPVLDGEIRAHVRVDGRVPQVARLSPSESWVLLDTAAPRSRHVIEVDGALRSADGEGIESARRFIVNVLPPERGVGLSSGSLVVPRSDERLIAIRHRGVDSIVVIVARIADSARTRALTHAERYGDVTRWRAVIGDSLVLRYAVESPPDSERVFVVPIADLPAGWRGSPMLAVRARGVLRDTLAATVRRARRMRPLPDSIQTLEVISILDHVGEGDEPHFAIVRRTDLATHVWHAEGEARVWVTGVRDARPRAGVAVRVLSGTGQALGDATTDRDGMARVRYGAAHDTSAKGQERLLETRLGADVSLRVLAAAGSRRTPWRNTDADDVVGYGIADLTAHHGAAFADRGIYRPGESVYLKGIVRHNDPERGYIPARGDSVRWIVRQNGGSGRGDRVWSTAGRLGQFGSAVDTFTVPRTARLGAYTASLDLWRGGVWWYAASASFAVAEYRVPEFAVRATADSTATLFSGDTATVHVDARYLFGLPMQGASVGWWASLEESDPWELRVAGLEGLSVGRSSWLTGRTPEQSSEGPHALSTDASGAVTLAIPVGTLSRPGRLMVRATATDANRQAIVGTVSLPVQAADLYVGARLATARWVWPAGEAIPVQALVVGLDGRRRAGVTVRLLALRYEWRDGRTTADTAWRDERVSTSDTMRVGFTPPSPGSYELLLAARDARGREAVTSLFTWVESPRSRWVTRARPDLPIAADKARYQVGDRAAIRVEAADDGPAWLTLSHEGRLREQLVQLRRGGNVLPLEIPEWASPSARVTVLALRRIPPGDTSRVYTRRGQLDIEVATAARALKVALVPERTHYAPRERVRLTLHVRDALGNAVRAEAAVWAVDEGVASLTALEKPDLLQELLRSPGQPFSLTTSLDALAPWLPPAVRVQYESYWRGRSSAGNGAFMLRGRSSVSALEAVVASSGEPEPALRELFATTPLYRGAVVTDANGDAAVEFELPDNLTTFHLFAAAVGEGMQAGAADTTIVSSRVLAVRPALPRVIRDGDSLLAGAVVTQDRDGRMPVSLTIDGAGVLMAGVTTLRDTLDGRRAREIRFALRGIAGDTAVLRFRGTTDADGDAVEARLPVSPGGHPRAHVAMGTLRDAADVAFPIEATLDTARSRLELQLGSTPLPMLRRLSETLRLYPYSCTEQLASGGRTLVARIRAERSSGMPAVLSPRDRRQLEFGVATIVARQRYDGAFGYWSATNWSTPWLTVYALDFLVAARDLGVDVPAGVVRAAEGYLAGLSARARAHMGRYGNYGMRTDDTLISPSELLSAALAVRSLQHPDTALERHLLTFRSRLGWVDRLSLAQLLAARGDTARAQAILAAAWSASRTEGRRIVLDDSVAPRAWGFRSILRPVAALLTTATMLTPNDERLAPLFESLLQLGGSGGPYGLNTIDATLASEAVLARSSRPGAAGATAVTVSVRGHTVATVMAGGTRADTVRIPLAAALARQGQSGDSARVGMRGAAGAATYYAATLYEVPTARPVRADDEGISVERWYERFDDARPIVTVREGELVRVRIRVTVPRDREFVAIEDPLPAGLEAVDLSLRTSSELPPYAGAPRLRAEENAQGPPGQRWFYGSWDGGWWTPWEHREIRDDRVLYFARQLWKGSYLVSYVARATTAGTFVRPPTHAEEMYNPAVHGRSDGGWFTVEAKP